MIDVNINWKFLKIVLILIMSSFFIGCKTQKGIEKIITITKIEKQPIKITNALDSLLKNAHVGICIYDIEKKENVQAYQSDKYFIPASNLKIATCYAALKYLDDSLVGLNYLEDDTSIQIKGNADPTFLNSNFKNQPIYNWLKTKASKKIYLLNAKFNTTAYANGWSWDDYLDPFMAERSSFPIYENTVSFNYNNGFKSIPNYFENNIISSFDASNNDYRFNVTRKIGKNDFIISPGKNISKKITFSTEIQNYVVNNKLLARLLSDTLHQPIFSRPIYSNNLYNKIFSQSKDEVLKSMMYSSDNFIGDHLLLMISNEVFKEMDENKIIPYLLNNDFGNLPQIPRWVDGSGLSRYNLISPEDFVFILNKIKEEFGWQRISKIFAKSNEGTLRNMFLKYDNKVFAKTGTLSNVYCLSGFFIANSGKEFIFSILVNNHLQKNAEVKIILENYLSNLIETN